MFWRFVFGEGRRSRSRHKRWIYCKWWLIVALTLLVILWILFWTARYDWHSLFQTRFWFLAKTDSASQGSLEAYQVLNASSASAIDLAWRSAPEVKIDRQRSHFIGPEMNRDACNYYTCFNPYRCGFYGDYRMTVFIYPLTKFVDEEGVPMNNVPSREFVEILNAIRQSEYFEPNPALACLFVPAVDVLNQNRLRLKETGLVLKHLDRWNNGENHLLFNMLPGVLPEYNSSLDVTTGLALIAGGGFSQKSYRQTFDVSIPVYNSLLRDISIKESKVARDQLLLFAQMFIHERYKRAVGDIAQRFDDDVLVLDVCPRKFSYFRRCTVDGSVQSYLHFLQTSEFCLILDGARLTQPDLFDALKFGCIPVLVSDDAVLPFFEVLDWQRAVVQLYISQLPDVVEILRNISTPRRAAMRAVGKFLHRQYFSTTSTIALTTLRILNDRIFPHAARRYEEWNFPAWRPPPPVVEKSPEAFSSSIEREALLAPKFSFITRTVPNDGFTALLLTYDRDRVESLARLVEQLAAVPSCVKIVIVCNNPLISLPDWSNFTISTSVLRMRRNSLHNRFLPFPEIQTEAILQLDDDISTLNTDEIEFGYQVWREFPDHLVGYLARLHVREDNVTRLSAGPGTSWRYDSEWRNELSMVLTGAAFYHKYFNFVYTKAVPQSLKRWIDDRMNCEDILMNFVMANFTGLPVIKVGPRKKFRCPQCGPAESKAETEHMLERSECINKFVAAFGYVPLKVVEFRAEPVLYKVNVSESEKAFPGVGPL